MTDNRITQHPILRIPDSKPIQFMWQDRKMFGYAHDTVASALIANNIHIFGHHHKDHSPQGLFCANGQCAQCTVLINGTPLKACMTHLKPDMDIFPLDDLPSVDAIPTSNPIHGSPPETLQPDVLIIGGGPAGLSAAARLGESGIKTLVVDYKSDFGGKLLLQTHRFFGSVDEVHAGHRGIEIAKILVEQVKSLASVTLLPSTKAVAVFEDQTIGLVREDKEYLLVKPQIALFATGARENTLLFPGNTLPGVIGAGAFQTLVNRDLVRPGKSIFIVGGGNVGLIAGYHALQAGIEVKGLIEAQEECGGYQVHRDKLARLGVPILTSHTIIAVNGIDHVESITIASCENFKPIPGTEKTIPCDTVLIAVGLHPVNELYHTANKYGLTSFAAGDAAEISEASAAMITGKMAAIKILENYGYAHPENFSELEQAANLLKKRPNFKDNPQDRPDGNLIYPIFHCEQEIPCNPCSAACPIHNILIPSDNILTQPIYLEQTRACINCGQCISVCPGLAITIVDRRKNEEFSKISLPIEFLPSSLPETFHLTDEVGKVVYSTKPIEIRPHRTNQSTLIAKFSVPAGIAAEIVGFQLQPLELQTQEQTLDIISNDTIVCRCERVTAGEIRALIKEGITDINQIKAITRAGMGSCGSKTCHLLIQRLLREEGVAASDIIPNTSRPLEFEVEFQVLANSTKEEE